MANPQPTTGDGSGIGNKKKKKKKKKKTLKESDSDDEDEPTSSPQTRKQKADKKKKKKTVKESDSAGEEETDERTWTDWGFSGLNIRGLMVNRVDKKAEVERLIDEHKLDILVIGESHLRDALGEEFEMYHQRYERRERRRRVEHEQFQWNEWDEWLEQLEQHEQFYDWFEPQHVWLQPQHDQLEIENFSCVRFDRTYTSSDKSNTKGGGLLIYIRKEIQFSVAAVFEWTGPKLKVQYVKLAITRPFRFDLVAIYSPPKGSRSEAPFLVQRLMTALLMLNQERNIPVMFIGDMNIDRDRDKCAWGIFVPRGSPARVRKLFDWFRENYRAEALINDPTSNNGYCIDHIITNIHEVPEGTGVRITEGYVVEIPRAISDHDLIYCRADEKPESSVQKPNSPRSSESSVHKYKYTVLAVCHGKCIQVVLNDEGEVFGFPCESVDTKETIKQMEKLNRPKDGKKIACLAAKCNEKFDTYDAMEQHEYDKHFPCLDCDKVLKSKYYGPVHMQKVHGIYMCRDVHCNDLRFNDSQERDAHENDGNHLVCKQCKPENRRAFSSKAAYKRHKKSHRQHGAVATK